MNDSLEERKFWIQTSFGLLKKGPSVFLYRCWVKTLIINLAKGSSSLFHSSLCSLSWCFRIWRPWSHLFQRRKWVNTHYYSWDHLWNKKQISKSITFLFVFFFLFCFLFFLVWFCFFFFFFTWGTTFILLTSFTRKFVGKFRRSS